MDRARDHGSVRQQRSGQRHVSGRAYHGHENSRTACQAEVIEDLEFVLLDGHRDRKCSQAANRRRHSAGGPGEDVAVPGNRENRGARMWCFIPVDAF